MASLPGALFPIANKKAPVIRGFAVCVSKAPEFGTFKSLPIPPKLAKQPGSGQNRIMVESPVGVTVAGVPVLPATTDALE